ncbi:MAG: serine/threonine-protein kinase [Eubacteriales bacterium]|nr:serine/threonine-protein kinase [Eubacteriales bacterium]
MLGIGDIVSLELSGHNMKITKKLGEGGQGAVYLVEGNEEKKALKWYNKQQSTDEQRASILKLIQRPLRNGEAMKKFVWPQDLAKNSKNPNIFGYIMDLIDTSKFVSIRQVWADPRKAPGNREKCLISMELADAFRQLHLEGYCYRDISDGNFMFNPRNGEILICDNDNVGIEGISKSQVLGTMEYMAPELIVNSAKHNPSTLTDLHSLAVLLFSFWIWHHPMHGEQYENIRILDIPAKKKLYGTSPVFIFDSQNYSNKLPSDNDYADINKMWGNCPQPIKDLFSRAFTDGLKNPNKRVTEREWYNTFCDLSENLISCPKCRAKSFWYKSIDKVNCWNCGSELQISAKLKINGKILLFRPEMKINMQMLDEFCGVAEGETIVAQVVHVKKPEGTIWAIENTSDFNWTVIVNGEEKEAGKGKKVGIRAGVVIRIPINHSKNIELIIE